MKINFFYLIAAIPILILISGLYMFIAQNKPGLPRFLIFSKTPETLEIPPPPSNLKVLAVTDSTILISWDQAEISSDVAGYRIFRNNQLVSTTSGLTFMSSNLTASTSYVFLVSSYTKAGAVSELSAPIQVSTEKRTVSSTPAPTPTRVLNPTPTPTQILTPPPAPACGSGGFCSAAQVAPHNSRGNCWVYLSPINKVYNITPYVANGSILHPGGDVIVPLCGQNMYNSFIGTAGGHAHSNNALNVLLQSYYIGPLQ